MELTDKLLSELQRRLKIGNRRGVHLNAIPANSRYKFDLNRLSHIDKDLPNNVWLYDLESTGTHLNDEKITGKSPLIGFNKLTIANVDFNLTTDKSKLL